MSLPKAAKASTPGDPVPQLYARARALTEYLNEDAAKRVDTTDKDLDALMDRIGDLEYEAAATIPTGLAGALAALEWAASEHAEERRYGDRGEDFVGPLLANVIAFLRLQGGAS